MTIPTKKNPKLPTLEVSLRRKTRSSRCSGRPFFGAGGCLQTPHGVGGHRTDSQSSTLNNHGTSRPPLLDRETPPCCRRTALWWSGRFVVHLLRSPSRTVPSRHAPRRTPRREREIKSPPPGTAKQQKSRHSAQCSFPLFIHPSASTLVARESWVVLSDVRECRNIARGCPATPFGVSDRKRWPIDVVCRPDLRAIGAIEHGSVGGNLRRGRRAHTRAAASKGGGGCSPDALRLDTATSHTRPRPRRGCRLNFHRARDGQPPPRAGARGPGGRCDSRRAARLRGACAVRRSARRSSRHPTRRRRRDARAATSAAARRRRLQRPVVGTAAGAGRRVTSRHRGGARGRECREPSRAITHESTARGARALVVTALRWSRALLRGRKPPPPSKPLTRSRCAMMPTRSRTPPPSSVLPRAHLRRAVAADRRRARRGEACATRATARCRSPSEGTGAWVVCVA